MQQATKHKCDSKDVFDWELMWCDEYTNDFILRCRSCSGMWKTKVTFHCPGCKGRHTHFIADQGCLYCPERPDRFCFLRKDVSGTQIETTRVSSFEREEGYVLPESSVLTWIFARDHADPLHSQ